jgi:hypothetical protein
MLVGSPGTLITLAEIAARIKRQSWLALKLVSILYRSKQKVETWLKYPIGANKNGLILYKTIWMDIWVNPSKEICT